MIDRSTVSAALLSTAVLSVLGWAAVEYVGAPMWLVGVVVACLIGAIIASPGSSQKPSAAELEQEAFDDE